jgi:2-polyprenyl-3-methyl-5-hydroxy-6-metoxy-1,4-benzoquinol methylase
MIEASYNNFKEFSELAKSDIKSSQKIGFDELTRNASVDQILFNDMIYKVNYLLESNLSNCNILDIGCGCSYFTNYLIKYSALNNNNLYLVDSEEMLSNINTQYDKVIKIPAKFPISTHNSLMNNIVGKVDLLILNSVIHHVFLENNLMTFIESAIKYLDCFGVIYIGDIPNASMQNRQLDNYHEDDFKRHRILGDMRINDSIIVSLLSYFRGLGFNAYIMPKPHSYKFSNSREDLIITKI